MWCSDESYEFERWCNVVWRGIWVSVKRKRRCGCEEEKDEEKGRFGSFVAGRERSELVKREGSIEKVSLVSAVRSAGRTALNVANTVYDFLFDESFVWEVVHAACIRLGIPKWMSWLILCGLTSSIAYYFMFVRKLARVFVNAQSLAGRLTQQMSILASPYSPTPWAFNRHLTTILGSELRSSPPLTIHRESLDTPDGGNVALDWMVTDLENEAPILFIAPGLTGSSESSYVRHAMVAAAEVGFQPVVMIYRGLVGLKLTTPLSYSAGATSDIHLAVQHVHRLRPHAPLYAIGFSVGSNILVKYLGEQGKNTCIRGALSVGNPFHLTKSSETLGSNPIYSYALCKLLKRYYATHRDTLIQLPHFAEHDLAIQNVGHLRDFDRLCTAYMFKFDSVDHYYTESSSSNYIERIQIPLLFLSAEDDPVVNLDSMPIRVPEVNPNIIVVLTKRGGHLGFLEGWWPTGRNWADRVMAKFLSTCLEMNLPNPQDMLESV